MVKKTIHLDKSKEKHLKDSTVIFLHLLCLYCSLVIISLCITYSIYQSYTSFSLLQQTIFCLHRIEKILYEYLLFPYLNESVIKEKYQTSLISFRVISCLKSYSIFLFPSLSQS